jgi:purine-binding chemotaxis protein CheW
VLGIINLRGELIPVVSARRRFQLPEKEISPFDHLLVARSSRRRVALAVDAVNGLADSGGATLIDAERVLPRLDLIEGIVKLGGGMILIHDLDRFLSLDEETALDRSLRRHEGNG